MSCLQLFSSKQVESFLKRKVFLFERTIHLTKDKDFLKESENLQLRIGLCIEKKAMKL